MRSACQGAKEAGEITVGTPGRKRGDSNEFVDLGIGYKLYFQSKHKDGVTLEIEYWS